jgi:hypothetical protein
MTESGMALKRVGGGSDGMEWDDQAAFAPTSTGLRRRAIKGLGEEGEAPQNN